MDKWAELGNQELAVQGSKPSQTTEEGAHILAKIVKDAEGSNKKVADVSHTPREARKLAKPCWLRDFIMTWQC